MRQELVGAILLSISIAMLVVLRPRHGVPVSFIQRSSANTQSAIGLLFVLLFFGGAALMITGIFY